MQSIPDRESSGPQDLTIATSAGDSSSVLKQADAHVQPINDPVIGTTLGGRYEIIERLGAGAMGVVYKARQVFMDRVVAAKTIRPQLISDPEKLNRFALETKVLGRLKHKNIVAALDFVFSDNGQPFFIMEFIEGTDLADVLTSRGSLPTSQATNIVLQTLDALGHAHRHEILHRDIKPSNIILVDSADDFPLVKVVDFGTAKMLDGATVLTQAGNILGSPLYMSPEQCQGSELTALSDIYSLGVMAYQLYSGSLPFHGDNYVETMRMHCQEDPPLFSTINPQAGISPDIERAIRKALEKNPPDRFQDANEFKQALELCAQRGQKTLSGTASQSTPKGSNANAGGADKKAKQKHSAPADSARSHHPKAKSKSEIDPQKRIHFQQMLYITLGILFGFVACAVFFFVFEKSRDRSAVIPQTVTPNLQSNSIQTPAAASVRRQQKQQQDEVFQTAKDKHQPQHHKDQSGRKAAPESSTNEKTIHVKLVRRQPPRAARRKDSDTVRANTSRQTVKSAPIKGFDGLMNKYRRDLVDRTK